MCMSMQALGTLGRGPEDSYLRRGRANAAWPVMGAQRRERILTFTLHPAHSSACPELCWQLPATPVPLLKTPWEGIYSVFCPYFSMARDSSESQRESCRGSYIYIDLASLEN